LTPSSIHLLSHAPPLDLSIDHLAHSNTTSSTTTSTLSRNSRRTKGVSPINAPPQPWVAQSPR
jgi:hypothetical protein